MHAKQRRQKAYKKGLWAEALAAFYLMLRGYSIIRWRYKCHVGEIDLIAAKGGTLAVVEVKARSALSEALDSVTIRNRARVERATLHFLSCNPDFSRSAVRFDVVALTGPFSIHHLDNAWQARS